MQLLSHLERIEQEQEQELDRDKEHNSNYWIKKFMQKASEVVDPEVGGVEADLMPTVSLATSKWGRTLADVKQADAAESLRAEQAELARLLDVKERTEGALHTLLSAGSSSHWSAWWWH